MQAELLSKRAAHTSAALMYGNMLSSLLGIVVLIVVARLLGPSQFGAYTLAVSYYLLVDAAAQYGLGVYINKHLAQYASTSDTEMLLSSLFSSLLLAFILAALTTAVGIGMAFYVAKIYANSGVTVLTLAIASSIIFFSLLYSVSVAGLTGLGRNKLIAEAMSLQAFAELVLAILLVLMGYGVNGALAGVSSGYALGAFFAMAALLKEAKRISGKLRARSISIRPVAHFIAPLAAVNILGSAVGNFSVLFLGIYVSASVIGAFGIASRGVVGLTAVYVSITSTLLPVFSIAINRPGGLRKEVYNKLLAYSLAFVMPIFVFVAVLSKPLVYLFVSSKYLYAPLYLTLITIGMSTVLIGRFLTSLFGAANQTVKLFKLNAIAAAVQFVLVLLLVPLLKAIGAIVSVFFVGYALFTFLMLDAAKREIGVTTEMGRIAKIYFASFVLGVVLLLSYLAPYNIGKLIVGAILTVFIYPIELGAIKAVRRNELEEVKRAIEGLPGRKLFEQLLRYTRLFASD